MAVQVYPVNVELPDGTEVRKAKMIVSGGVTTLYTWDSIARVGVPFATVEASPTSAGMRIWQLPGETEGTRYLVRAAGGCGCGDPMKRWMPPGKPVVA